MAKEKHSSVAGYIIVALILGVITYVEFAIVEHPQAWLGRNWTLFWLIALSIVKFVMVVMYFMHLKDDDSTYTGFFSSGMFIAMATFVGFTAMFILPRAVASTQPQNVRAGSASHEVPADIMALVESDGMSRTPAERADSPRPADRSVTITAPRAGNDASTYGLNLPEPVTVPDAEAAAAAEAEAAEAAAADEAVADATETETAEAAAEAEPEAAEEPAADTTAVSLTWDADQGASVYTMNCVACHQGSGQGIPGAFPPLAEHAADVYAAGGEVFLVDVVLYGMQGPIQVSGTTYNGLMLAWSQFSDEELANVLNHIVTAWNDPPAGFVPYQPADIAAERGKDLSDSDVHTLRGQLGL
jgi:mono/diheme cytochrome c family protein/heme/copper-type cytochrome/quinol oxidase subunit 4